MHALRAVPLVTLWCGFAHGFYSPQTATCELCARRSFISDASSAFQDNTRPIVTLKLAIDSQGAVDDLSKGESWRFTSSPSLDLVHRLRAASDAVAVGSGTVLRDNPSLTVRRVALPPSRSQPLRVIFDRRLRCPWGCTLLQDEHRTQLFTLNEPSGALEMALKEGKFIDRVRDGPNGLAGALEFLKRRRGVDHLMVEGGPELAAAFLGSKLVDRAIVVVAEKVAFNDPVPSGITDATLATAGLECISTYTSGEDTVRCWTKASLPWPSSPNVQLWP